MNILLWVFGVLGFVLFFLFIVALGFIAGQKSGYQQVFKDLKQKDDGRPNP
jgi:hypothetical protein